MATVAMMVVLRALIIVRGILWIAGVIVIMVRMTMFSAFGLMQRRKHLTRVRCKHTTLEPDHNAEQREPCEQGPHQRPNPSCKS